MVILYMLILTSGKQIAPRLQMAIMCSLGEIMVCVWLVGWGICIVLNNLKLKYYEKATSFYFAIPDLVSRDSATAPKRANKRINLRPRFKRMGTRQGPVSYTHLTLPTNREV